MGKLVAEAHTADSIVVTALDRARVSVSAPWEALQPPRSPSLSRGVCRPPGGTGRAGWAAVFAAPDGFLPSGGVQEILFLACCEWELPPPSPHVRGLQVWPAVSPGEQPPTARPFQLPSPQ